MWERDPSGYARKYFHGEKSRTNRGQALGKRVADSLETGEETGDAVIDVVIAQMPKYEIRDKEVLVDTKILGVGFPPMLLKMDSLKHDLTAFYEYKTYGETSVWTQNRVDKDDQMTFYFTGIYIKTGKIPKGELIAAPTEKRTDPDGMERPYLTGEIKRFPTTRTLSDIIRMQARISKAWKEIGDAMTAEVL